MNAKKIGITVLLLAVIAAAVVFTVRRARSQLQTPTMVVDQKFPKIDVKSLEVFWETNSDWATKYAPDASGRWKSPGTGEHTIVNAMTCMSCGQLIPVPQYPASANPPKSMPIQEKRGAMSASEVGAAGRELLSNYICPRCGKHAWFPPPPEKPKSAKSKSG
jgi:hypothetical protein